MIIPFIAGGSPDRFREVFLIKDSDGYIATTESYVRDNPHLFRYIGHFKLNSTVTHTFEFIPDP